MTDILNERVDSKVTSWLWLLLGYTLVVILWGVFVRASLSGDGCGTSWPLCNGQLLPHKDASWHSYVEYAHRLMSGLSLILIISTFIHIKRKASELIDTIYWMKCASILIVIEALIGAGLVLFGYVTDNPALSRVIFLSAHLFNTLLLLSSLALAAWTSVVDHEDSDSQSITIRSLLMSKPFVIGFALLSLVGVSGVVASLASMLFPATTLIEGVKMDFSSTSHWLIRLRVLHPLLAIITSVFTIKLALYVKGIAPSSLIKGTLLLVITQVLAGTLAIVLKTPLAMLLIHLLLADLLIITFVLLWFEVRRKVVQIEIQVLKQSEVI